jgi:hypothetical protein
MTNSRFRRRGTFMAALILFAVSSLVVTGWQQPAAGSGPKAGNVTLDRVKLALGCWESGGRYDIRNGASGAFGKYQIMPSNWASWARQYLGRGQAKPTPANQEQVASGKLRALQGWLGGWDRVLYWWLTGATGRDRAQWSDMANRYVDGILSMANRAATRKGRASLPKGCFSTPTGAGQGGSPGSGGKGGPQQGMVHRRVTVSSLHVRAHAGTGQASLGFLGRGDVVSVLDRVRDSHGRTWIRIARNGSPDGWVARWFTVRVH